MTELTLRDLGLRASHGGCGCGCGVAESQVVSPASDAEQRSGTYLVDGMTCGHCAQRVTDQLRGIAGVSSVVVDLQPGGVSRVTVSGPNPVDPSNVVDAVAQAGYRVVGKS